MTRSSQPISPVIIDLEYTLPANVIVAIAVTIHRAQFVATALLATLGPVPASMFDVDINEQH